MKNIFLISISLTVLIVSCMKEEPESKVQKQELRTGATLLTEAKEKLTEAKEKLTQEGKYNCCITDACNYCALNEGSCPCYKELKAGEHVCVECYAGWQQGKGADKTIRKEDVKTDFVRHAHKH